MATFKYSFQNSSIEATIELEKNDKLQTITNGTATYTPENGAPIIFNQLSGKITPGAFGPNFEQTANLVSLTSHHGHGRKIRLTMNLTEGYVGGDGWYIVYGNNISPFESNGDVTVKGIEV